MSELHIEHWGSGDRVAVLLHGITADSSSWWRAGPELARHGYRVIAPDLPGHGRSTRWSAYSLESMTDAVIAALPERPALAMGHSLGALLLARAESRIRPDRVVYEDPAWAPSGGTAMADVFRAQKGWSLEQIQAALPRWEAQAHRHKLAALARWDPATLAVTDGFAGYEPSPPTAPALVVLADPSAVIPPQRAEDLRGRGFEVRVVPGTGHVIHNEDFDGFWAALKDWR